jgi:uncharacterized protein (TIGR02217 family)
MAFIEQRLLSRTMVGASGGPTFSTRRIPLKSGIERRNATRSMPLHRYVMPYGAQKRDVQRLIDDAFIACMAGVTSFRFKDDRDFVATNELLPVLGTGAPQEVQLIKTYAFGSAAVARRIRKPVSGSVSMTDDAAPLAATIDYATGIATFTASVGGVLRWSGQFDVPVFFEDDEQFSDIVGRSGQLVMSTTVRLKEDMSV